MDILSLLFRRRRNTSQAQAIKRAAAVIDHVIFDVGVETLVGGTFVLDRTFRLRFIGVPLVRRRGVIAVVEVGRMAEAELFRQANAAATLDAALFRAHGDCLAHAVVRELAAQSPAFRALPPLDG